MEESEFDTMIADDAHRAVALANCDHPERIAEAAEFVAARLNAGLACEIALAPGNMTRYAFLFVPIDGIRSAGFGDLAGIESSGVDLAAGVFVGILNGYGGERAIYPLDLIGRSTPPAPSYLQEKWFPTRNVLTDDVFVFEALLQQIGERTAPREVGV